MSDSVRPHRQQPTRLPHPWDSPGKNTGVGCHFLLQCVKVKSLSRVRLLATPWTAAHQALPSMGLSRQEYWSGVPLPSATIVHRVAKIRTWLKQLSVHLTCNYVTALCVCVCVCVWSCFSRVCLFATLWTVARQAPLSMQFSRQE